MKKNLLTNIQNARIIATKKERNLSFYFVLNSGDRHYLMSHSDNQLIWNFYKNGMTIGDMSRLKPQRTPAIQKLIHFNDHLLKVINSFIRYEL